MSGRSRSYKEGLLRRLRDNAEAANYLEAAIEDSHAAFLVALKNVLDARKVAAVARQSGVSREHIYQMLTKSGNPRLNSLEKILRALGLRIGIRLERHAESPQSKREPACFISWRISEGPKRDSIIYQSAFSENCPRIERIICNKEEVAICATADSHSSTPNRVSLQEREDCYEMAY